MSELLRSVYSKGSGSVLKFHRTAEAAVLLQNTDISVREIAYSVGFADPKHFSQMFKRKYGMTPGKSRIK